MLPDEMALVLRRLVAIGAPKDSQLSTFVGDEDLISQGLS